MRTSIVAAVVGGLLAAGVFAQDAAKKDAQSFQGTWKVVSVEFAGLKPPPRTYEKSAVVISGERITFTNKSGIVGEATFKLDLTAKPKAIDLSYFSGRHSGKTQQGIYSLERDTLRLCTAATGKQRPTEFATKPETEVGLLVFERVKE